MGYSGPLLIFANNKNNSLYNCVAMQLVTGKPWLNIKPLAVLLGIGKWAIPIGQDLANRSQYFA